MGAAQTACRQAFWCFEKQLLAGNTNAVPNKAQYQKVPNAPGLELSSQETWDDDFAFDDNWDDTGGAKPTRDTNGTSVVSPPNAAAAPGRRSADLSRAASGDRITGSNSDRNTLQPATTANTSTERRSRPTSSNANSTDTRANKADSTSKSAQEAPVDDFFADMAPTYQEPERVVMKRGSSGGVGTNAPMPSRPVTAAVLDSLLDEDVRGPVGWDQSTDLAHDLDLDLDLDDGASPADPYSVKATFDLKNTNRQPSPPSNTKNNTRPSAAKEKAKKPAVAAVSSNELSIEDELDAFMK